MNEDFTKIISEANKELIEKGNFSAIEDIFPSDYLVHAKGREYHGHRFVKRFLTQLRSAIPDVRIIKIEFLVWSHNIVVWQRTLSGTHKSEIKGVLPTGKKLTWRDMVVSRFDKGKIIEEWTVSELTGEMLSKQPPL